MNNNTKIGILFVCTGNICRSPTAEAVFQARLEQEGLQDRYYADSAGTHDYHVGNAPDTRAISAALERGYDLQTLRARQVSEEDFEDFHLILAMDYGHKEYLQRLAGDKTGPSSARIAMFTDYASDTPYEEVPDPYYGAGQGFITVLDLVENSVDGLVKAIRDKRLTS